MKKKMDHIGDMWTGKHCGGRMGITNIDRLEKRMKMSDN